jgi:hypothetical protein
MRGASPKMTNAAAASMCGHGNAGTLLCGGA